jgi:hypothetical protein
VCNIFKALAILVWGWRSFKKSDETFLPLLKHLWCVFFPVFLHYFWRRLHNTNGATDSQAALQSFQSFQSDPIANANYSFSKSTCCKSASNFWKYFIRQCIVKTIRNLRYLWSPQTNPRFRSVPSYRHILIRRSSCGQYF